jgi:hypothetical protein
MVNTPRERKEAGKIGKNDAKPVITQKSTTKRIRAGCGHTNMAAAATHSETRNVQNVTLSTVALPN